MKKAAARRQRAPNRVAALYSRHTLRDYRKIGNRWQHYAAENGIDARYPSIEALCGYFTAQHASRTLRRVRRESAGLFWFFNQMGVPNLIDHPLVQRSVDGLSELPEADPLGLKLDSGPEVLDRVRRRAQWFSDKSYDEHTCKTYATAATRWVSYANAHGFDPMLPSVASLEKYISEMLAADHAFGTVNNAVNGIAHYFLKAGVPDVTRDVAIRTVLKGIRNTAKRRPASPIYFADVQAMLRMLDPKAPTDVRDGLLLICMCLGGLAARHLRALDVHRREVREDGIVFHTEIPNMRTIFIGESRQPEMSVKTWFNWLLGFVGDEPGPLFPIMTSRGQFTKTPLRYQRINMIVRSLAKRAGIEVGRVCATSVRKGFIVRVAQKAGPNAAATAAGYDSPRSIRHLAPYTGESLRAIQLRNKLLKRRRDDSGFDGGSDGW
jgi:site-specific recombinase XerD